MLVSNTINTLFLVGIAFVAVIKGVITGAGIAIFVLGTLVFLRAPSNYFGRRSEYFWTSLVCIMSPLITEIIVQCLRGSFDGPALDSALRCLTGGSLFVLLSNPKNRFKFIDISSAAILSIVLIGLSIVFYQAPSLNWGGRATTYFVDPITLSLLAVAMFALVQDEEEHGGFRRLLHFLLIALIVLSIVIETQSRTGLLTFLSMIFFMSFLKSLLATKRTVMVIWALLTVTVFCISQIPTVQDRFALAYREAVSFFSGDPYSSVGLRLAFFKIDFYLFKSSPFFGWSDHGLPALEALRKDLPWITPEVYQVKLLAGSHSEIMAQLSRKGIFGLLVFFCLFMYPLYVHITSLARKIKNGCTQPGWRSQAIIFHLVFLVGGFGIQVLNLKMMMTLFSLVSAYFLARACFEIESQRNRV